MNIHLYFPDSKRDWGHAKDYVRGMWLMLQQEKAENMLGWNREFDTLDKLIEDMFIR